MMRNRAFTIVVLLSAACVGTARLEGPVRAAGDGGAPRADASVNDAGSHDAGWQDAGLITCDPGIPAWFPGEGPRTPSISLDGAAAAKRRALERRRLRLLEALLPGSEWATLRVEQADITCGRVEWRRLVDIGRGIFEHVFTTREGLGNGLAGLDTSVGTRPAPNFRRFQYAEFGGPETVTCTSCHWKGGEHGAGDRTDNSYLLGDGDAWSTHDERNPPALLGLGWVQIAAQEMNGELAAIRDLAIAEARRDNAFKSVSLVAKGISFGELLVAPDGSVDAAGVVGVDKDLVIKPFGWKGVWPNIRRFAEGSLQFHFGIQSETLVEEHKQHPIPERVGNGPNPDDPDNDGVVRELTQGQLSALEAYLATLEVGVTEVPQASEWAQAWIAGEALFSSIGCATCHVPYLEVDSSTYRITPETGGHPDVVIDLAQQSAEPRPQRDPITGRYRVYFYSDFRRHDMGDEMRGPNIERGVGRTTYLTRRLWGLSRSSPYLYDGRAATFDEAIAAHGGEAAGARDAFQSLESAQQGQLRMFLLSLTRARDAIVR
ncbi:MAG: di-heme oxidoredictase family protein [Myxococcota bacterium]